MEILQAIGDFFLSIIIKILEFYLGNIMKDGLLLGVIKDAFATFVISVIFNLLINIYNATFGNLTKKRNGKKYENKVAKVLEKYLGVPVFQNVLLPINDYDTTEIDMVYVTNKGVFCVECKYRSGVTITCDTSNSEWTLDEKPMKNPFNQNNYHIHYLEQWIKEDLGFEDIIIWNVVATNPLLKVTQMGQTALRDMCSMTRGRLLLRIDGRSKKTMKQYIKEMGKNPVVLTEGEVLRITEYVKSRCATKEQLKEHVKRRKESQFMEQI